MKKTLLVTVFIIISGSFILQDSISASYKANVFRKLKLSIPKGFMYGRIPRAYKKWIVANPAKLPRRTVRRLAGKIYPGGSYRRIAHVHMAVITKKKTPYGDDIVCYYILFRDKYSAKKEFKKLNDYVKYNSDRALVITKNNMAIYLHVDDVYNFHLIKSISKQLQTQLDQI